MSAEPIQPKSDPVEEPEQETTDPAEVAGAPDGARAPGAPGEAASAGAAVRADAADPAGATDPTDATGATGATGATVADGVRRQLDPAIITVDRIAGLLGTGSLGVFVVIALPIGLWTGSYPGWLLILLGALALLSGLLTWYSLRWPVREYRHAAYRVSPVGLEIWMGVLWRKVTTVPRSRVQHTDVAQGPLQRRYGLATLHLHTAGSEQADVALRGLRHETALAIRDFLLVGHEDDAV